VVGVVETALVAISVAVLVSAFLGMTAMLLAGLNERRREMAILRAVGAGPRHVAGLLVCEAAALSAVGAGLGLGLCVAAVALASDWLGARYGLYLSSALPGARDAVLVGAVIAAGALAGVVPAVRAVRQTLADGLVAEI
ncbi:MAG: ABC transporter permease, partial [Rhodospirillaceae bacterium]